MSTPPPRPDAAPESRSGQMQLDLGESLSRALLGPQREGFFALLRDTLGVQPHARGDRLTLDGDPAQLRTLERLIAVLRRRAEAGDALGGAEIRTALGEIRLQPDELEARTAAPPLLLTHGGQPVKAKTHNQARYLETMGSHPVTVALGPAGTGKTYLAVARAVVALREKQVARIVLSRPTIEAGEKLGFLPGDLLEKVDPYFRPLYDALRDFLGGARFSQLLEKGVLEITPLAYMRGRTFNESFMILDEAQNTTIPQMKMFLTRMGYGSRAVVTGDPTQVDLPDPKDSSLVTLPEILAPVRGVGFIRLGRQDVVRHELVQAIVEAYGRYFNHEDRE